MVQYDFIRYTQATNNREGIIRVRRIDNVYPDEWDHGGVVRSITVIWCFGSIMRATEPVEEILRRMEEAIGRSLVVQSAATSAFLAAASQKRLK